MIDIADTLRFSSHDGKIKAAGVVVLWFDVLFVPLPFYSRLRPICVRSRPGFPGSPFSPLSPALPSLPSRPRFVQSFQSLSGWPGMLDVSFCAIHIEPSRTYDMAALVFALFPDVL
jgi:hypothetical protein